MSRTLAYRESIRSVGRSKRVGARAGAESRNEMYCRRFLGTAVHAHRPDIFDRIAKISLTADYADAIREGSHPKAG